MSEVIVRLPPPLRTFADGKAELRLPGATVGQVLSCLSDLHPGVGQRLFGPDNELRPYINIFHGERHIARLEGLATPVRPGDVVSIIPAVAGG